MKADQVILTRQLPKTGQETELLSGDDGTYQAGWWKGLKVADNKTRFIVKTLNGDDVVIDLATGLMWAADGNAAGCNSGERSYWGVVILYVEALDFAGFSDWRVPNIKELVSLVDYSHPTLTIPEPPFENTFGAPYWSSTSYAHQPTSSLLIDFSQGIIGIRGKADNNYVRCVRGGL